MGNKLAGDFREKANHFNKSFASICTPIDNSGCLSISVDLINLSTCFFTFNFADDEILKIIRALDINKACGHETSVRMIKVCDDAIIEPLSLIYKNCIENGTFPAIWKKPIIVPVDKKEINRLSIIIDLFHCYPCLVKYLKEFYLTHYLIIFKKIISFVNISLGFNQVIHAYINYFQLYIFMLLFDCSPLFNV